jgi:CRISPR-associated protein Cas1
MGESYYLFADGDFKRKDNILIMKAKYGRKKEIKVEVTDEIYLFGEVDLNTKMLNYMSQKGIFLHIFNYYGFYSGSYVPRDTQVSGKLLVRQVEHYQNNEKRVAIAKEILHGASYNIHRNLRYYKERGKDVVEVMEHMGFLREELTKATSVQELMGVEGNIRKLYYSAWTDIINKDIEFEKRVKRPPDNMINSLISYINSLVYTTVLGEIYKTSMNPTISYLHEAGERRFSLSLDIAEIFKPLITDRIIFSALNKGMISEKDFEKESNFLYLKDRARKLILQLYDEKLKDTIKHKDLGKHVSYRYLMRLELYKLIKHLNGDKEYEAFRIWW